ncbi:sugar ABC transporter substrate-binding protein [Paenibacillus sp. FSL R10-2734]|uniref:ABC transporter substrate-binding protein n=1 Tax=Paenibacillus sp. FSL R10-2734 TaxID=2954691 RepID=UPI0030D7E49E
MNRMKSLLISTFVIVLSAGLLGACSSNNSESSKDSSDKAVTINYYDWTDEQPYMTKIVSAFQEKYPNIKVNANFIPSSDYVQKMLVNLSTGGGDMDVFASQNTSNLSEYISKQVLEPLDDVAASSALSGISESINQLKNNDHIYGLPYRTSKWALFYNKDLFDKAGVTYPDSTWTWDDYEQAAKKLTSGSGQSKVYGSMSYQADNTWWRVLANIQGANNPLNADELKTFMKAVEYNYNLTYTSGAQQPFGELVGNAGADFTGRFLQGNVAMMWNGDWAVQMLNDAIAQKGTKVNYDIAPLPHWEDSEPATTGSFAVVMVNKASKKIDAAKKFAEFLASEDAAKIIADNGLLTPWTTDAVNQAYLTKLSTPANAKVLVDPIKVLSQVPMDPLFNQGLSIVKEEASLYLLQKQSIEETTKKIESRIQKEVK